MAEILLGLGSIYFYVPVPETDTPNYETLSRDSNYSWIASPRLGRSPAMQATGVGEETVVIEGRLYPHHFGGLSTIVLLRKAAEALQPYDLVRFYPLDDPNGYGGSLVGKYVIKRVRTVDQKIASDGLPHRLDFSLELMSYGEDADLSTT